MHLPEIERLANCLDLCHEAGYLPECEVVRFIGTPGAELIIADDTKSLVGKAEKRRQVFRVTTRSTVQQQQRAVTRARAFIPDATIANVDVSLTAESHCGSELPHRRADPAIKRETRQSAKSPVGSLCGRRHQITTDRIPIPEC